MKARGPRLARTPRDQALKRAGHGAFQTTSSTGHIVRQMKRARDDGAHIVRFSEGARSGYAGTDFPSFRSFDWQLLQTDEDWPPPR